MRKTLLLALLILTLLLAACTSATPTTTAPDPGASPTEATSGEEPAGEEPGGETAGCSDALGCVEVAAGAPIRIAAALVVAGPDQSLGVDSRNGIEIAIDDAGGELLGHPVELVVEDTGCTAEGGQAAAQKLASDQSVVAVIGTSCSSEARAAAPIISDAGLAMVSPSNTAPDLTAEGTRSEGYMRTAHNDKVQGAVAAEFVYNELGLRNVATIHDGSPYAEGLVEVFTEEFTALGGTVSAAEAVGPDDSDMRSVLGSIAATSPEMIYFPVFTKAGGLIAQQSDEVEGLEDVALMGADGLFSPDFIAAAGESGVGMYLSSPDFSSFGPNYTERFVPAYQEKFGTAPISAFHAHAYDAYNMIAAAIEAVAVENADGSLTIGRQALRDALMATSGLEGLTGSLSCDEFGDCADPNIAVYQITQEMLDAGTVPTEKIYP